ncbi:hypothetical protein SK128_009738 [Halocaridina rubra]|uniref:Uncharacterized protein n=1 Tax=Halocaridina rubra TaxID=373956 RepID=A0AAN9AB52_HALRR
MDPRQLERGYPGTSQGFDLNNYSTQYDNNHYNNNYNNSNGMTSGIQPNSNIPGRSHVDPPPSPSAPPLDKPSSPPHLNVTVTPSLNKSLETN